MNGRSSWTRTSGLSLRACSELISVGLNYLPFIIMNKTAAFKLSCLHHIGNLHPARVELTSYLFSDQLAMSQVRNRGHTSWYRSLDSLQPRLGKTAQVCRYCHHRN